MKWELPHISFIMQTARKLHILSKVTPACGTQNLRYFTRYFLKVLRYFTFSSKFVPVTFALLYFTLLIYTALI